LRSGAKRGNNAVMSLAEPSPPTKPQRIEAIDLARGVALIAMATYHFSWDLEFFGYLEPGTTSHGALKLYARCIASSFLVLVGISLVLAHDKGVRWRPFLIRFAQIVIAALAITAATWWFVPSGMIFFGILHEIAFASLAGLVFVSLPALPTLGIAALVIAAPLFARSPMFDHPGFWWLGLSSIDPRSNDYVPVFPWFGAVLIGIAMTRFATDSGLTVRLAAVRLPHTAWLRFAARHSLVFYLIHQPILVGLVWTFAQFAPPVGETPQVEFRNACEAECKAMRDEEFCARYCACVLDAVERLGITDQVFAVDQTPAFRDQVKGLAGQCTKDTEADTGGAE
jgi:uncharacterized membrane protein